MIFKIAADPENPLWKEVADRAVKTAVSTFVSESIKAAVEIWKTRHLKEIDAEFEERSRARKSEAGDAKDDASAGDDDKSDKDQTDDAPDDDEADDETGDDDDDSDDDDSDDGDSDDDDSGDDDVDAPDNDDDTTPSPS